MQMHTVEVGEVVVIDGVRFTVLAIIDAEVIIGMGEPEPTPEKNPPLLRSPSGVAWLHSSPN